MDYITHYQVDKKLSQLDTEVGVYHVELAERFVITYVVNGQPQSRRIVSLKAGMEIHNALISSGKKVIIK